MADQNLPDYQPRKFIDTGYVKDLSVQHRKQSKKISNDQELIQSYTTSCPPQKIFAFCICSSNVVTADLL